MMVTFLSDSLHLCKHVQYFPMFVLSEVDLLHHVKERTCLLSLYKNKKKQVKKRWNFISVHFGSTEMTISFEFQTFLKGS